jgi:hypothetical protein
MANHEQLSVSQLYVGDGVIMPKTAGKGLRVDTSSPSYPWQDIIGLVLPDQQGVNAPTLDNYIGGIRRFRFSATDKCDNEFHIPHDYLTGSNLYLHYHWGHNGTSISGSIVATMEFTYAKGYSQMATTTPGTLTFTNASLNLTKAPQHATQIEELQLSTVGGGVNQLNTSLIEPDGIIGVNFTMVTIPTISGGNASEPFVFFVDVHYQSTGIGSKQRNGPNFYT